MRLVKYILLLLLCTSLTACGVELQPTIEVIQTAALEAENKKPEILEATVIAVGDIMFHLPQVKEARTENGYDFSLSFEKIKPYITGADIAIGNFETTVNENKALSGYPRFNSPPEVLEGIRSTGFDVMVTANNHCMDTGLEGAENTAALIRKNKMIPLGVGEKNKSAILDVKGIKLGILAYTTSINGLKAPAGYVSMADEGQIKKDIEALRRQCDFIIVYMHAGIEYNRNVEESTARLYRSVADMGADCVLGSHPHVARKSELYYTMGKQVLINYSMGNFLSNQNDKYTDIGSMTKLVIKKQGEVASLDDFQIIPTYRLRFMDTDGKTKRRIILTDEIDSYSHISEAEKLYIKEVQYSITKLMGQERTGALDIR